MSPKRGSVAPRGKCSVCKWTFAIRKDGTIRRHGFYDPGGRFCAGSLKPPLDTGPGTAGITW